MQHKLRFATGLAAVAFIAACADSPVGPAAVAPTDGPLLSRRATSSGTTLSATKTATGFREERVDYDWTVKKTLVSVMVGPHMLPEPLTGQTTVTVGDPRWLQYRVDATRHDGARSSATGVRGNVCVTNGGSVATEGLAIIDVVQTRTGSGPYQDYATAPVDVLSKPVLAPGETYCYPYEVALAPQAGAQYRNTARVTITNHSGYLGQPFGPGMNGDGVKADFSIPETSTPVTRDASARLGDQIEKTCTSIFPSLYCSWDRTGGTNFLTSISESTTVYYIVDLYNMGTCNEEFPFTNTVTLTESGPRAPGEAEQVRTDATTLLVKTGACAPKPANPGCTLTVGYYKNHAWDPNFAYMWEPAPPMNFFDTGITWRDVLDVSPKGDAYFILAHQYIAARLNQLGPNYVPPQVVETLKSAYAYFSLSPDARARVSRSTLIAWADQLDQYNNGKLGVPHCR